MRIVPFLAVPLLALSAPLFAQIHEMYALEGVTKQLLKDSATEAAPSEAVEGAKTATESLDKAKNLKESAQGAQDAAKAQATEAVKEKAKEAVPEEAKQGVKAAEHGVKSAKSLKKSADALPKSTGAATEAVKEKGKEEAAKKALDMLN